MEKKRLKCPVCGFNRLIDAQMDVVVELKSEKEVSSRWIPDFFQKCSCCKQQIAIKKVS